MNLESRFFFRLVNLLYFMFLSLFLLVVIYYGYNSIPKRYIDDEKSFLICENGLHAFKNIGIYLGPTDTVLNNHDDEIALTTCANNDSEVAEKLSLMTSPELNANLKNQEKIHDGAHVAKLLAELKNREMIPEEARAAELLSEIQKQKRFSGDSKLFIKLEKQEAIHRVRAAEAFAELKRREMFRRFNHPFYTLSLVHKTEGSWKNVFLWWFLGGSIIYITLNIMKEALLYLIFGRRFAWDWLLRFKNIKLSWLFNRFFKKRQKITS